MLYRLPSGNYRVSSPDGEHSKDISKEEGEKILKESGCPEELLNKILSETTEGFVMT
jgi:hypothetical protein